MSIATIISFALACLVLNIVPGPGMVFIISHGLSGGRRSGMVAATGMATGTVVHTLAAALGLSALLRAAPFALDGLRIAGAVFLIYLAINAYRSATTTVTSPAAGRKSMRRVYASAVLTNVANPKVVLFYLAFVPQFLTPGGWAVPIQILVLGSVLTTIGLALDVCIGLAAGTFSALLLKRRSFQLWLKRISAAIFGGLAVVVLADRP